jgi:hypothetical protein
MFWECMVIEVDACMQLEVFTSLLPHIGPRVAFPHQN